MQKITYGIDLGTTNSAISKFDNGRATIIKNSLQSDTTPSCVAFPRQGRITVGARARTQLEKDYISAFRKPDYQPVTFIEFKRLMGTDHVYECRNYDGNLTPETLSGEVLRTLRRDVLDDDVKTAVITVPAMFTNNQKDATKRAAKLAGFDYVELIQEPVAASIAFGLDSKMKNAYWLVFDLGGGTFDAALMRIQDGVMQAIDTAGNNRLGGKDIDRAIVDKLFMPYFTGHFTIDNILKNNSAAFCDMWKAKAEEAKIQLSFVDSYEIETDLGEDYGTDDLGEELSMCQTLTRDLLDSVSRPIFQQAIDITKQLLERNNLKGTDLGALILVGGPTHAPLLRQMLREQITPNVDTSVDPMTCVAAGASIYGSTIDVPEQVADTKRDRSKVQLSLTYSPTSVDEEEWVSVSLLNDKSDTGITSVEIEMTRADGIYTSPRTLVNDAGDVICLPLAKGKANIFDIRCFTPDGSPVDCEPNQISIIQGISGLGDSVLPLAIGIGVINEEGVEVFEPAHGLEKSRKLPSTGTVMGKKTLRDIRAGVDTDTVRISIYQVDEADARTRVLFCERQYDISFSGDDLPSTLPEGSMINISMHAEKSGTLDNVQVEIPYLNLTLDLTDRIVSSRTQSPSHQYIMQEIAACRRQADELGDQQMKNRLNVIAQRYLNDKDSRETAESVIAEIRNVGRDLDRKQNMGEWDREVKKLQGMYTELCGDQQKYGNAQTQNLVETLGRQMDKVVASGDVALVKDLYQQMWQLDYRLAEVEFYIAWIMQWNNEFNSRAWSNPARARELINRGLAIINQTPTAEQLKPIAFEIMDLLPEQQRPTGTLGK